MTRLDMFFPLRPLFPIGPTTTRWRPNNGHQQGASSHLIPDVFRQIADAERRSRISNIQVEIEAILPNARCYPCGVHESRR